MAICIGYLPYNPDHAKNYSFQKNDDYRLSMMTKEHGIKFYVKSSKQFDWQYPVGTPERADIEKAIIKEYLNKMTTFYTFELGRVSKLRSSIDS